MNLAGSIEGKGWANGFGAGGVFWLCLAAILGMSLPNLIDPMIRYDDYPALFAEGDLFWEKTLNEGRWVNYIWHLREIVTPAWLNFAIYQAFWALFAASLTTVVVRQKGLTFFKGTLALLILVSPSALLISLWFNTLLPGLGLVAIFGLLACRVSSRTLNLLLPIFVVATFMAYTTYPLLLLAIILFRQESRSFPKLIGLLALFSISFIVAILLTYTINWSVHGIFGVPLAEWREATPAHNLSQLRDNLPKLLETFNAFMTKSSFGFYPAQIFHIALMIGASLVLLRHEPLEALYIYAGLITGITLIVLQVLKLGVAIPARTLIFVWVFYAITVVRAAEILSTKHAFAGRMACNAALLIVGSFLLQSYKQMNQYRDWQVETRQISQQIEGVEGTVSVKGQPMLLASAVRGGIQSDVAFQFRMQQLVGRDVVLCAATDTLCKDSAVLTFPDN
ncbi:MAG: hypothetical protein ACI84R_001845 [Candidatus Azotimanducaceae bacterium]|jgi:hypothetical protein